MDDLKLAIAVNNVAKQTRCAVCGTSFRQHVGPELFVAASWAPVCLPCGRQHGRELVSLIETWRTVARAAAPYHNLYSSE